MDRNCELFAGFQIPDNCRQLVIVRSRDWTANVGQFDCFEWKYSNWMHQLGPFYCRLGGNGLGWGIDSKIVAADGPRKREGDSRSPAGLYPIGNAFGVLPNIPTKLKYKQTTDCDYWVDASNSPDYNTWQTLKTKQNNPNLKWDSFERMKIPGPCYELGFVIDYNAERIPMMGSAIFVHILDITGGPTSGCTALSSIDLLQCLSWLDRRKVPHIMQLPSHLLRQ